MVVTQLTGVCSQEIKGALELINLQVLGRTEEGH